MTLFKKAVRAMWDNKKAYIACVLLITIGIFIHNIMGIMIEVFAVAIDRYYTENRMADVFAKVRSMPASALGDFERMDGVAEAAGRYTYDARVLFDHDERFITLRITSVDPAYAGTPINAILTDAEFGSTSDIVVGQDFLTEHGIEIGGEVTVIINRREYTLTVCGTADSPEYVYAMKDNSELLSDPSTFGFAFMPLDGLWALTGQDGFYNDVCLKLDDGVAFENVKSPLEDELSKYGLLSLFRQKDHPSVVIVDMEFTGIAAMSSAMPLVFMSMAMIVLYLMLKRIIEQERTQIGVLKAFGYSNLAITVHYTMYGAVTGIIGGLLGALMAIGAAGTYIEMFQQFFKVPTVGSGYPLLLFVKGFAIALAGGVLGGYFGARRSLKLEPADAMRPEAPKPVKTGLTDKLPFLYAMLNTGGRMGIRSITRNPMRSAVIVLGIMFAFGLMSLTSSLNTIIDYMLYSQFTRAQRYDAKIIFNTPVAYGAAVEAAYRVDGVMLAEGILELPVTLKSKHLSAGVYLTGLESGSSLYTLYDNKKDCYYRPPPDGILLNDTLATKLHAHKGDVLYVSSPLLDEDIKVTVTEVAEQNISIAGFMEINALAELFGIPKTATAAIVRAEDMTGIKELADEAQNVSAVVDNKTMLQSYVDFMAPYSSFYYILWILSGVVAFAIIYNTSTISLSERKREYATLRVMGMQVKEVGAIMGFEYWVLCVLGMLAGMPFSVFLRQSMSNLYASDTFSFPTITPPAAYAMAAAGCILAVYFSNRSVVRQIKKFDMVEVLKERE